MVDLLTPKADELLARLIDSRNDGGFCDLTVLSQFEEQYGKHVYESAYSELASTGMIKVKHADNVPWIVMITTEGISYFSKKSFQTKIDNKQKRREWAIAIVSAAVGTIVTEIIEHFSEIIVWIGGLFK